MIEPQSGQGGASSSGRKAKGARDGSRDAAPTDEPPPSGPAAPPAPPGPPAGPEVSAIGITATGPFWCVEPPEPDPAPPEPSPFPSREPPEPGPSSFTCTPIAFWASRVRNFDASQRK